MCKSRGKITLNTILADQVQTCLTLRSKKNSWQFFLILPCKLRMIFPKKRDAAQKKSKMDFYYKINLFVINNLKLE